MLVQSFQLLLFGIFKEVGYSQNSRLNYPACTYWFLSSVLEQIQPSLILTSKPLHLIGLLLDGDVDVCYYGIKSGG